MRTALILMAIAAACFAAWRFIHRKQARTSAGLVKVLKQNTPSPASFEDYVSTTKARSDEAIASAIRKQRDELQRDYSDAFDVERRLSKLALENELDVAVVTVWREARHYPMLAQATKSQSKNILGFKNPRTSDEDRTKGISFSYGATSPRF